MPLNIKINSFNKALTILTFMTYKRLGHGHSDILFTVRCLTEEFQAIE